jgi:hypothetical protein
VRIVIERRVKSRCALKKVSYTKGDIDSAIGLGITCVRVNKQQK